MKPHKTVADLQIREEPDPEISGGEGGEGGGGRWRA